MPDFSASRERLRRRDEMALLTAEAALLASLRSKVATYSARAAAQVAGLKGAPAVVRARAVQILRAQADALSAELGAAILGARTVARKAALTGLRSQLALVLAQAQAEGVAGNLGSLQAPPPEPSKADRAADKGAAKVAGDSLAGAWVQRAAADVLVPSAAGLDASALGRRVVLAGDRLEGRIGTTAATEVAQALNGSRATELAALAEQGDRRTLPFVFKHWNANLDRRSCAVCRAHAEETVSIFDSFSGGVAPGVHPRCRCILDVLFLPMPTRARQAA